MGQVLAGSPPIDKENKVREHTANMPVQLKDAFIEPAFVAATPDNFYGQ